MSCSLPKRLSARSASSRRPPARTGEHLQSTTSCSPSDNIARPIPQWFRLKSDSKIQVRVMHCTHIAGAQGLVSVQRQAASLETHEAQHLSQPQPCLVPVVGLRSWGRGESHAIDITHPYTHHVLRYRPMAVSLNYSHAP